MNVWIGTYLKSLNDPKNPPTVVVVKQVCVSTLIVSDVDLNIYRGYMLTSNEGGSYPIPSLGQISSRISNQTRELQIQTKIFVNGVKMTFVVGRGKLYTVCARNELLTFLPNLESQASFVK